MLIRAFTVDQYRVINATKGLSDLDVSLAREPFYGFRQEIRAPKLDPSLTILVSIESIDRSDSNDKIVGYAYFHLFLDAITKKPITNRAANNYIL